MMSVITPSGRTRQTGRQIPIPGTSLLSSQAQVRSPGSGRARRPGLSQRGLKSNLGNLLATFWAKQDEASCAVRAD